MKLGIGLDLLQTGVRGIAPPSVVESTWSTADATTGWTLSNADKTALRSTTAAWRHVRGTTGHASGKYYFEIAAEDTVAGSSNWMTGLSNAAANVANYPGGSVYGLGIRNDLSFRNGFTAASGALWASNALTAGDTMMFAVNATSGKIWIGFNGTWRSSGDPAGGTAEAYTYVPATIGALFPAVGAFTTGQSRFRLKTGTFNHAPPSGFSAWE